MGKKMLFIFLGLVLAVSGLNAVDENEQAGNEEMEQVIRTLRENGASERLVAKVLRDMTDRQEKKAIEDLEEARESLAEFQLSAIESGQGTEGASNTLYGSNAGIALTTGTENSFFGRTAGYKTTSGYANSFFGFKAGYENISGHDNIFIGSRSGQINTTGSFNLFIGKEAGYSNTTGNNNVFAGYKAGKYNSTGYDNIFLGKYAGLNNTNHENVFIGSSAGYNIITGNYNTFIGNRTGQTATTGNYNTFVGFLAGQTNGGTENTFIGNYAGNVNLGSRNIFIGNEADISGNVSDKLVIANVSPFYATPLIYGDFVTGHVGINNHTPGYMLAVGSGGAYCDGGAWMDGSSREVKENIEALTSAEALQAFAKLEPVKFNYKQNKQEPRLGFIAEDVPELVAEKDRKGLSPMDMVAVLTKVVQEQQKTLTELQEQIAEIKRQSQKEK